MDSIIQLLVSGIAMGFIYCLVAIEYTLIWNASGLINFAHEKFIVMAAFFFGGTAVRALGLPLFPAMIVTMIFMALFGILVSTIIINPLRNLPSNIFAIMGAVTLSFLMREAVRLIWGPAGFTISGFLSGFIKVGGITISIVYFYIIGISIALLILQWAFMSFTKAGKSVRCVQQDKVASALMGINVKRNIAMSVAISAAICGIIGMIVIPLFSIDHNMATMIALKGFSAGVVGGFGTYTGAIVGGLTIGVVENAYLIVGPNIYKDVVSFMLLIVFLVIKPSGITGKKAARGGLIVRKTSSSTSLKAAVAVEKKEVA